MCQNCFKPNRLKGISGEARATDRQVNRSISKRQANFRSKKLGYIGVISHLAARFASKSALLLFVLAFWGLLLYSWYRSF